MRAEANAQVLRKAVARPMGLAAATLVLCFGSMLLQAQRRGERGGPPPARAARPAPPAHAAQQQRQTERENRQRQAHAVQRPAPQNLRGGVGPATGAPLDQVRPLYPGGAGPEGGFRFPPGHLGSWLNQHRDMPFAGQERLLQNAPSFQRLPKPAQQRLMQQLRQVDRMPPQERERRLARAELIEHMSPQDRMALGQSMHELSTLSPERRAMVRGAFRDLRGVPVDQRQTVIDSKQYQRQFSPEERNMLTNLLKAEPFEPAK